MIINSLCAFAYNRHMTQIRTQKTYKYLEERKRNREKLFLFYSSTFLLLLSHKLYSHYNTIKAFRIFLKTTRMPSSNITMQKMLNVKWM